MTRDFASKSKKRSNATRFRESNKETNNSFKTIILGLVLGITIALIAVYYYQSPSQPTEPQAVIKEPAKPSAKNRYQAVPADEVEHSDFSFHEELPNKTVDVEVQSLPKSTNPDRTWVMQCGSFKKINSAENLKARVALIGFEAYIRTSKSDAGTVWHRVLLGPYKSKRQAERERHELERNNINNCRIW